MRISRKRTDKESFPMNTPQPHEQNADQIAYWNGPAGQRWADRQAAQDVLLGPVADRIIDRAKPKPGGDGWRGLGWRQTGRFRGARQPKFR